MSFHDEDSDEYVTLEDVTLVNRTEMALLVKVDGVEEWIPISQVHRGDSTIEDSGDVGELVVKRWIARDRGWV